MSCVHTWTCILKSTGTYSGADLIVTATFLVMTGRIDGSYVAMLVQILISLRFSYIILEQI